MIFSENNNQYFLETGALISPEEIQSGLWIVIAGIDSIPPHIALINDGQYFSISAKKIDLGIPLQNFLKAISKRSVPTLFVKIKRDSIGSPQMDGLRGAFERYPVLGNGDHSCLWPIRDFFAHGFSQEHSKPSLVFELLAMLQKDNLLVECKSLFAESMGRPEGIITLPKYTHEQIREKINSILYHP